MWSVFLAFCKLIVIYQNNLVPFKRVEVSSNVTSPKCIQKRGSPLPRYLALSRHSCATQLEFPWAGIATYLDPRPALPYPPMQTSFIQKHNRFHEYKITSITTTCSSTTRDRLWSSIKKRKKRKNLKVGLQ